MKTRLLRISIGDYYLMETEEEKEFIFYRKDEKPFKVDLTEEIEIAAQCYNVYRERCGIEQPQAIQIAVSSDRLFIKLIIIDIGKPEKRVLN